MCGHEGINISMGGSKPKRGLPIDEADTIERQKEVIEKKRDAAATLMMPKGPPTKPTGYRTILT